MAGSAGIEMGNRGGAASKTGLLTQADDHGASGFGEWRQPILFALCGFVIARVLTEGVALLAAYHSHALTRITHDANAALTPWLQYDAIFHLDIAQHGYPPDQTPLAAFPPLPWLIVAGVSTVLHLSPLAAGLLVSAAAELVALVLLFRLAQIDIGLNGARLVVIAVLVYPSALFLTAPYAEPETLLFGVAAMLCARRGRWWLAGLLLAAATLSKLFAIVFVIPVLLEYVQVRGIAWRSEARGLALVALPPLAALAGWMVYAGRQLGDPLLPISAEHFWGRALAPPWVAVSGAVKSFFDRHLVSSFDLVALVLIVAAGIYAFMRIRRSYGALLLLSAVAFSVTSELLSTSRFALVCFPLFIAVAHAATQRKAVGVAWAVVGVPLAILLTARFATGIWAG